MPVVVRLLGPLEAEVDGERVELGPPQQRALLGLLAAHADALVKVSSIEEALWRETPPPSATKVIQTYVSRLRKTLGGETIRLVGQAYVLDSSVDVDARTFRQLIDERRYAEGLELWRGDALADVPMLADEAEQLNELRVAALEEGFDAELQRGEHPALVAELERLVARHPTRERLLAQLVLALYRSGRQADALAAYRNGRRALVEKLGLEPGVALRELERSILRQDPDLLRGQPGPADETEQTVHRRRRRRRLIVAIAVVAAAVAAGISSIALGHGKPPAIPIRANSLLAIDPKTNTIVRSIPIARDAAGLDATPDALWIASERDSTVSRLDLGTYRLTSIGRPHPVAFITHDDNGNIYASGWDFPYVWQIDPRTVRNLHTYRVRKQALGLSVGGGSLWVVERYANAVARIDLAEHRVAETIPVGVNPLASTFGYGALWVANGDSGTIAVLRPGAPKPIVVRGIPSPFGISAGAGGVWVASNGLHAVYRIDPDTHSIVGKPIDLGTPTDFLFGVSAGSHGVWAVEDHHIVRIDPATDTVVARIRFPRGTEPKAVASTGKYVWVTVGNPKDDA